jgi:PAS domain S-box-containing protein
MDKKARQEQIFKDLERIANMLPTPLYWLNTEGVVIGANDIAFKMVGGSNIRENILGKEHAAFYPKDVAETLTENNNKVIQLGETVEFEEKIVDLTTGIPKYLTSIRSPLRDEDGEIIGIVGTSIDITSKKDAENLIVENATQKAALEEQIKFKKLVEQVNHDIRSPLASLQMLNKQSAKILPEKERLAYSKAITRILDIANNMMQNFKPKEDKEQHTVTHRSPTLISAELLEIFGEKKYQFNEQAIEFVHEFSEAGNFAFLNIDARSFKRMISNLINNAADALEEIKGKVVLFLDTTDDTVRITIQDNGKGMPPEVLNKLMNYVRVTEGKKEGYGIGYQQIQEALKINEGKLAIESTPNVGTQITLTFEKALTPDWMADKIILYPNDEVVVLDDDPSIHDAWEKRFEFITPKLSLRHFELGQEAVDYLNGLSPEQKQNVFLLADYELLKQHLTGLDVIHKTTHARSILVTSHHTNPKVLESAKLSQTKILPKLLATDIPIIISVPEQKSSTNKIVDMIIIDDDINFGETLISYLEPKTVDYYPNPFDFLNRLEQYSKDIIICLDHDFKLSTMDGFKLAKELHEKGYKRLYLLSGRSFLPEEIPSYVTFLNKVMDTEKLLSL